MTLVLNLICIGLLMFWVGDISVICFSMPLTAVNNSAIANQGRVLLSKACGHNQDPPQQNIWINRNVLLYYYIQLFGIFFLFFFHVNWSCKNTFHCVAFCIRLYKCRCHSVEHNALGSHWPKQWHCKIVNSQLVSYTPRMIVKPAFKLVNKYITSAFTVKLYGLFLL